MRRALPAALLPVWFLAAAASAQALPFVGGDLDQDLILERLRSGHPRTLRQVGTSSVTLRADLGGGMIAAYKPRTDSHPHGYLAEIAAYRVARLLGMDNVPPVTSVRLPRAFMRAHLALEHEEDWDAIQEEIRWDSPGVTRVAAIYWIPRMRPSELATEAGVRAAASWLAVDGEVPEGSEAIARDLGTLFAFDYLIGNWDRLSGGNVSRTDDGGRLFVRDHNVAFGVHLRGPRYARIRRNLERVQRFSRSFVQRLMALDEGALREALRAEPEAEVRPILGPEQIDALLRRRRALLSYVGALVAVYGADRVMIWP